MIVLTGAFGFIGSVVLGYLNEQGITDIIIVDEPKSDQHIKNIGNKNFKKYYHIDDIKSIPKDQIDGVIHLGAISNTLEKDWNLIYDKNILSTRYWNDLCEEKNIPFIFASSAAITGNGNGPLNYYALSKKISENENKGISLRLFNVYGPNEYHKDRMASTIYHWNQQLKETGELRIFENSDKYRRDFVYVKDVARIIFFMFENYHNIPRMPIDVGTGNSASFDHIADTIIDIRGGTKVKIPMPDDLRDQYQLNTQADLSTLMLTGFDVASLKTAKEGIKEYLEYLSLNQIY